MGLLGILWKVIALAVLAVIGLGAYLYFSDYEVSATVVERGEDSGGPFVVIQPDTPLLSSFEYKAPLERETWQFVCEGYNVKFHVKSQDYVVYDKRGRVVYNSETGNLNQAAAVQCGASNAPGGILG